MQEIQSGEFTIQKNVNVDLWIPEFSATKIVTWKCHVDESTNSRYDMNLGRDLLTSMGLHIKFFYNVITFS